MLVLRPLVLPLPLLAALSGCELGQVAAPDDPGGPDPSSPSPAADAGAPGGADGAPVVTGPQMLAAFGDCMSYDDWLTARLYLLPGQETDEGDTCVACHEQSGTGAFLSEEPTDTFRAHRQAPSLLKLAQVLTVDGVASDVVPNRRYVDKGREGEGHPTYVLDPEVEAGLDLFVERTHARFLAAGMDCVRDDP